jgi:cell division protein FtsZ
MAEILPEVDTSARIKVIGCGGGGGSAVNRMIEAKLQGVEFVTINTDAQALLHSKARHKIHIGRETTRGLGAGADPEVGRRAAEESEKDVYEAVKGSDMVFLTLGEGGGTGTGAAPLIASAAREAGALVVAIVTKPFTFEGDRRRRSAEAGIVELKENVDTLITIPNDRLLQMIDRKTSLVDAFGIVDEVLQQGVQGISSLITIHGLINLDFADVKAIMSNAGSALMGIGRASGDNRATEAARQAIDSPLLETSVEGARGVLFNITGGKNMTMHEIDEAAKTITDAVDPDANIIFGAVLDENMDDDLLITVVATGFDVARKAVPTRQPIVREQEHEQQVQVKPVPQPTMTYRPEPRPEPYAAPVPQYEPEPKMAMPELEPEPEPEPEPYVPPVMNTSRKPFINERPQVEPEPEDVVPIQMPKYEPAPPRRFPSLTSIEPADNEEDVEDGPTYEPKVEMDSLSSAAKPALDDVDLGLPTDDDLDVPAFIRRKVD